MNPTDEQKAVIFRWIEEGASLSEIQKRLKDEMGVSLTYLEARMLADDLKLNFKEPEVPTPAPDDKPAEPVEPTGKVSVTVDRITRPGSIVSGNVVFSDGQRAEWSLDQTGRLGLNPETPGYRPQQKDVADFQVALEQAVRKSGL